MLIIPAISISWLVIHTPFGETFDTRLTDVNGKLVTVSTYSNDQPDIYYVILDGYARDDILQDYYALDNSNFVGFLREKGFYVASQSQSNYMQTVLSLASSLNMRYFDFDNRMSRTDNRVLMMDAIYHSRLRMFLEENGYTTVVISSGWDFTDVRDADIYLTPYPNAPFYFENFWLANTAAPLFVDLLGMSIPLPSYKMHRTFITYDLEMLAETVAIPGPKLVFVHISAPHPPFVFDRYGHPIDPPYPYFLGDATGYQGSRGEYLRKYADELLYINQQLEAVLSDILTKSVHPPIIVVQADHGPGAYTDWDSIGDTCLRERFSILNAYYLPDGGAELLYPTISPVNTFRVILDHYFDADLGLLPDLHYFSTRRHPYQFIDVTNRSEVACHLN